MCFSFSFVMGEGWGCRARSQGLQGTLDEVALRHFYLLRIYQGLFLCFSPSMSNFLTFPN